MRLAIILTGLALLVCVVSHAQTDHPVVVTTPANEGVDESVFPSDSLSTASRTVRKIALLDGMSELCAPWRTVQEGRQWRQTRPAWMNKVSDKILDRMQLLREKNLLVEGRRHLAAKYSDDLVPVDSLARFEVECRITIPARLDKRFFASIGGQQLEATGGYLTAWMPPEQIHTLAERLDVLFVDTMPAGALNQ